LEENHFSLSIGAKPMFVSNHRKIFLAKSSENIFQYLVCTENSDRGQWPVTANNDKKLPANLGSCGRPLARIQ